MTGLKAPSGQHLRSAAFAQTVSSPRYTIQSFSVQNVQLTHHAEADTTCAPVLLTAQLCTTECAVANEYACLHSELK